MDCNNSDLPKGSSSKITCVENNLLNTDPKADSPLMKKSDPDKKRVEELSAKEQELRRKFKEKFNKLKKMPMPPQPTINVNSEGLTEGELTIENVKRKFKQIFSKFFKESLPSATPELEKTVGKKQPNAIKVCVGTKPIESAIYRFTCVLPLKRSAAASKDFDSMLCKSVGGLPEQYINNEQIVFISKNKPKAISAAAAGNNEQIILPPKPTEKQSSESKVLETKEKLKLSNTTAPTAAAPVTEPLTQAATTPAINIDKIVSPAKPKETDSAKPTIDLAPYDMPKANVEEKPLNLVAKEKIVEPVKHEEIKQPIIKTNNVRGGILSSIAKNFAFDWKMFKPKSWFSGKSKETKMRMMPFSKLSKIPLRWRQGFVILGTLIPFYYTYHKIVTDNKLTTMRIPQKN